MRNHSPRLPATEIQYRWRKALLYITNPVVVGSQAQICSILSFSCSILVKFCVHLRTNSSKTLKLLLAKNIVHEYCLFCYSFTAVTFKQYKTFSVWHWLKEKFLPVVKSCPRSLARVISSCFAKRCLPKYGFKMSKNWHTFFETIFQVSADERMGKYSKLVEFWTRKLFQIRVSVISARKAKHVEATTMFTYSHANTPLGQSERSYYLSCFRLTLVAFCLLSVIRKG